MPEIISRKEARARGLKRYFTGELCPHGHQSERMVSSGGCILCKKDRQSVGKTRHPHELHFPDQYFQGCYRRAVGGCLGSYSDEYVERTNKHWLDKWAQQNCSMTWAKGLAFAQEEVGALQSFINDFRRYVNDQFSRNLERHERDQNPHLGCVGPNEEGESEAPRGENGNRGC